MGPEFNPKMSVKSLTSQQAVRIHQLFRQAKFDDPNGDVSASVSQDNFLWLDVFLLLDLQTLWTCNAY